MRVGTKKGEGILNFALAYDLFVANTLFRKRVSHLVTFSNGIVVKLISSSREERIDTLA
jgi:hypothetical protein